MIEKNNSKEHLKLKQDEYENSIEGDLKIFDISAQAKKTKNSFEEKESVNDKLNELNNHKENNIEWSRQGELIIPKKI